MGVDGRIYTNVEHFYKLPPPDAPRHVKRHRAKNKKKDHNANRNKDKTR